MYSEADLQEHVGKAQSSLAKQLADERQRSKEAADAVAVHLAELEEIAKAVKTGDGTRASDLQRERDLKSRETVVATREFETARAALAAKFNLKPDELKATTTGELRVEEMVLERMSGKTAPPPAQTPGAAPNRGLGTQVAPATTDIERALAEIRKLKGEK